MTLKDLGHVLLSDQQLRLVLVTVGDKADAARAVPQITFAEPIAEKLPPLKVKVLGREFKERGRPGGRPVEFEIPPRQ